MNVLVLCLGNDIRRDDGVGWAVADELTRAVARSGAGLEPGDPRGVPPSGPQAGRSASDRRSRESRLPTDGVGCSPGSSDPGITVKRSALSGFYLLDELVGYDRVIVVDAVKTGAHPPGTVLSFPFEALGTETGPSPHAVGLPSVVKLGRQSGVILPSEIHIVAIEVDDMESIAEGLTAPVRAAVPRAVAEVRSLLAPGLR
jgi:hydrogenase maturation protease